uniref:Uncharacterized protein n=1 Tax=Anopheles albimanus TaxID=7167 RepID=A0A182FZ25_ANOAL
MRARMCVHRGKWIWVVNCRIKNKVYVSICVPGKNPRWQQNKCNSPYAEPIFEKILFL